MKNKNKIGLIIITSILLFASVNAENLVFKLQSIVPESVNELKVSFDKPIPSSDITSDLKIFKDIDVTTITKDSKDPTKINLTLKNPIEIGKTYNIFGVFGVDSSVDFVVGDAFGIKILTKEMQTGQSITGVSSKDGKIIELSFKESLNGNDFEFKVLEDLSVSKVESLTGVLSIKTITNLENNTNYILMIISLSDKSGNDYMFDESIYDFSTKDLTNPSSNLVQTGSLLGTGAIKALENTVSTLSGNIQDVKVPFFGTGVIGTGTNLDSVKTSTGNLVQEAMKIKETPDTGPETSVLMLLTLIINGFYFLTRKTTSKI